MPEHKTTVAWMHVITKHVPSPTQMFLWLLSQYHPNFAKIMGLMPAEIMHKPKRLINLRRNLTLKERLKWLSTLTGHTSGKLQIPINESNIAHLLKGSSYHQEPPSCYEESAGWTIGSASHPLFSPLPWCLFNQNKCLANSNSLWVSSTRKTSMTRMSTKSSTLQKLHNMTKQISESSARNVTSRTSIHHHSPIYIWSSEKLMARSQ